MTDIIISSGVNSSGLTISSGFDLQVQSGGIVQATTVLSGGTAHVAGTATGTVIEDFAELDVLGGGVASGTEIDLFGDVQVQSGGTAVGTLIGPGGMHVQAGGKTSNTQALASGTEWVEGGIATGTIISSRGIQWVDGGGKTFGTVINSGGFEEVASGGTASGTTVSKGGMLRLAGGSLNVVTSATLLRGGTEMVLKSAHAQGTMISGGYQHVFGQSSGTIVRSGGHEVVEKNGVASGLVISSGGRALVSASGELVAGKVFAGAAVVVSSGGTLAGGLTIHAGKVTLDGAMGAGQVVNFVGAAGTLKLDNLPAFQAAISGLSKTSERLDLGGFTFSAGESAVWTQSGTSGTLTVTDGAKVANLTLIGTYGSGDFAVSNDGTGGTFVVDAGAHVLAQAVAGLPGRQAAAAVHAGGAVALPPPMFATATSGR